VVLAAVAKHPRRPALAVNVGVSKGFAQDPAEASRQDGAVDTVLEPENAHAHAKMTALNVLGLGDGLLHGCNGRAHSFVVLGVGVVHPGCRLWLGQGLVVRWRSIGGRVAHARLLGRHKTELKQAARFTHKHTRTRAF